MSEIMLVLGKPQFKGKYCPDAWGPVGQFDLVQEIKRVFSVNSLAPGFREEYLAIGRGLKKLGEDFAIVDLINYTQQEGEDEITSLTTKSVELHADEVCKRFPRDAVVTLPGLSMLNSRCFQKQDKTFDNQRVATSPLGEGGLVLNRNKILLISQLIGFDNGRFAPYDKHAQILSDYDFSVAAIPNFKAKRQYSRGYTYNDHIDRVGSLIEAKGRLHLILDPGYCVCLDNVCLENSESIDMVRRICETVEVEVHTPNCLKIPYSISMFQGSNGKVLMTSGDEEVQEIVTNLVGKNKVITTEIPIILNPAFAHAGIHCLIVEYPTALCC